AARLLIQPSVRAVTTQQGLEYINQGRVESAKIIDGEQRVDLELKSPDPEYGQNVQFYYVSPRGEDVVNALNAADLSSFDDEVPQQSIWTSLLFTVVPFIILILLFWFLMTRMQGGG